MLNRAESIVAGSLIISSSFNHEFVVTYANTNFHKYDVPGEGYKIIWDPYFNRQDIIHLMQIPWETVRFVFLRVLISGLEGKRN